jgi:predicted Zn-dependent protease
MKTNTAQPHPSVMTGPDLASGRVCDALSAIRGATQGRALQALPRLAFAVLALTLLLAPALPARAGLLDKIRDAGGALQKAKDTTQKAATVTKKTKRVADGVRGFPLEQEIALGEAVSLEITARFGGVWRDGEATRRVNLLGKALARYCDRQELGWVFGLLDSDTINAYSAPGGRVFITRGLYKLAGADDGRLAGVLAHEITHITRRHALASLRRGELLAASLDLAGEAVADQKAFGDDIQTVTGALFEKGLDPASEFDADAVAVTLCEATGFRPGGLRAALEAVAAATAGDARKPSDIFGTHPPIATRIARLPE